MIRTASQQLRAAAVILLAKNLYEHSKDELTRAGIFDKDADYGGALGPAVMELIETFRKQGHSGMSAQMTLDLFTRLAQFGNLTPITSSVDEWEDVSEMSGYPLWQNKRNPSYFSKDAGKTWYLV